MQGAFIYFDKNPPKSYNFTVKSIFLRSISLQKARINHQITAREVRVVSETGEQVGVMSLTEALQKAHDLEMDLVEIAPNAKPPVVKLINFDKFRYQQKKAEQLQKKNAKRVEVKTIRLSVRISSHDMQTKAKQTTGFLEDSNVVKIELRMRGREQAFADLAEKQIKTFLATLTIPYRTEVPIRKMGNTFSTTIAPTK